MDKKVITNLKNRIYELSLQKITENDIIRILKNIYFSNIKNNNISYNTYIEVTSYLVLLKSIKTSYKVF